MTKQNTHFQPDARHIVVVEEAPDMQTAEREADQFLIAESKADEAGCCYQRVHSSGIKRDSGYYFKVVATSWEITR
ncbi:MAG TPA: hypothetical protein VHE34_02265 [Puia sp.]|uniref:hypothetical protein n=1 Tax=Puia sp. TaxID=2045100 RepID=UPI002D035289|nr:hypothetical protein [Puia sp.]HVU94011.1 hypothetical protein [Puia sp.]